MLLLLHVQAQYMALRFLKFEQSAIAKHSQADQEEMNA